MSQNRIAVTEGWTDAITALGGHVIPLTEAGRPIDPFALFTSSTTEIPDGDTL